MSLSALGSRAISGMFFRRLENVFDNSWYAGLCFDNRSDQQNEEYRFSSAVPPFRKYSGQNAPVRLSTNKVVIANEVWETALNIPLDDLRRDKTGQIERRIDELAKRVDYLFDERFTTLITDGDIGTGFGGLASDGQYFFDTDHSEGSSGTLQNNIDYSDVASLNVDSATAPTQAEAAKFLLDVISYMLTYKDDQGEPINGDARTFTVVVPTNLYGPVLAATTNSRLDGASGTVRDNVLLTSGFKVSVKCNPRLDTDSTSVGYIFRSDDTAKPFIRQEEVGVQFDDTCGEGSEYCSLNRECRYSCTWVGGFGYGIYQYALRFTLS